MKIFDILFLRVRNQYIKWKEEDMPGVYAFAFVSLLQTLNILSICFLLTELSFIKEISKAQAISITVGILGLNALRYFVFIKAEKLQDIYGTSLHKKRVSVWIWSYLIFSFTIFISLITYHNLMKK